MDPDRIEAALDGLGPESRALVELSVIREVADEDIASLLGTNEDSVRSRREDALALLAADLGAESGDEVGGLVRDMRELPAVRWRGDDGAETQVEPEPEPPTDQPAKRKRRVVPILLAGLVAAGVVALIVALSGGDDEEKAKPPAPAPAKKPGPAPAPGKRAKLTPLAGGTGEGNAEVKDGTLELSVSGLPDPGDAGYVVWLYDSLTDARPLNQPQSKSAFELKAKLPEGAGRYRYLDISREPADENRNHSGESVLRVPLSSLK